MKILIACDMEGISGITSWPHVDPDKGEYQRFRRLMTADVNAAVAGAAAGGADEILIADGHWNSGNILIEELDPRAVINSGTPSKFSMVQGVDTGVDAALFLGYHARAGSLHAVLDHTWSSLRVANLWLNDRIVGEFGLNAALCGAFGVPVLMVSGDQAVCMEAREWVPEVEPVQVKKAGSRTQAECLPLEKSQALIRAGAERAVRRFAAGQGTKPLALGTPVKVVVEFFYSLMADQASLMPGTIRLDGRKLEFTAPDMPTAYQAFRAMVSLAAV